MKVLIFLFTYIAFAFGEGSSENNSTIDSVGEVSSENNSTIEFVENPPILKCVPGRFFMYDHNICFCNEEGTELICKRKIYSTLTPTLHNTQLQNVTYDCVPGKHFKHLCKECLCDESGNYASCVHAKCSKEESQFETRDVCIPGSVFHDVCNGCICGSDGKAACTKLDCSVVNWKDTEIQCVPLTELMYECNECFCAKDGKSMFCNKMGCDPVTFFHEHILNVTLSCEANSTFDYNCHKCLCGENGNYSMCSGVPCPHEFNFVKVEDTVEKCNPGMIFANDCNVCICGDDGKGVCTTFSCNIDYRFKYVDDLNFVRPADI